MSTTGRRRPGEEGNCKKINAHKLKENNLFTSPINSAQVYGTTFGHYRTRTRQVEDEEQKDFDAFSCALLRLV